MTTTDRTTGMTAAELALELMRVDSTSGREGAVVARAEDLLRADGWQVSRIPVTPGRDCLFATGGIEPTVTFSTHLDTVPPYIAPRLEGELLHGRGACDAKGIAAAMMLAATALRDRGLPVALLFVVGEETSHDGASAANAWAGQHLSARPRALVNGEPTECTLAVGTKGAMRVMVRARGRAAHSAYPEVGESAIAKLVRALARLEDLPLPDDPVLGRTTINIGGISGGIADNVIAPMAEARLMVRTVGDANAVWDALERWSAGEVELERGVTVPPVRLSVLDGFPTSVAAFATDIPSLGAWGQPYLYGPGSIHLAHTAHEHVRAAELDAAVEAYVAIGERLVRSV